jgi:hypothetical protein
MVRGDESLLSIAVENLLDSAQVPSRRKAVLVALTVNGEWARLCVESPGARIGPSDGERVFEDSSEGRGPGLDRRSWTGPSPLPGTSPAFMEARRASFRADEDARFVLDLPREAGSAAGVGPSTLSFSVHPAVASVPSDATSPLAHSAVGRRDRLAAGVSARAQSGERSSSPSTSARPSEWLFPTGSG